MLPLRSTGLFLCSLVLTACTSAGPTPAGPTPAGSTPSGSAGAPAGQDGPRGPERTGERARALVGGGPAYSFEVFTQPSVDGVCVEVQDDDGGQSLGCGFEVPVRQEVGYFVHQGEGRDGDHDVVAGSVVAEADTVRVEFAAGSPIDGPAQPVEGLDSDVFGIDVGARTDVVAVVGLAADGSELARRSD